MHKSQVLFYLLLAFLCGVFVASFLVVSQTWILVFLIFAIGLIAISGYQRTYLKKGLFVGVLFLIFIFGIIRFNSFNFSNSILDQFADIEVGGRGMLVTLVGYVDEEPDVMCDKSQLIFRVKEIIVSEPLRTVYYGNINLKADCNIEESKDYKKQSKCVLKRFYAIDSNENKYIVSVLSATRKTEKNAIL